MSRIEEIIKEKCPDGVEYFPLLSVANVLYGYPCDASLFNTQKEGKPLARIRDVLHGVSDTYTIENVPEKYELVMGDLLIGMDGNFHVANWKTNGGILCQRVCKVYAIDVDKVVKNGYLSHILPPIIKKIEENKPSGTVKHLLDKDIKGIEIPVPPIEVQQEIVRILDKFTELEAELQAELDARKNQYQYYHDELLKFDENVVYKSIESLCDIVDYRGKTPKKVDSGIFLVTAKNIRKGYIDYESSQEFIDEEDYSEVMHRGFPKIGDVLFTTEAPCGNVAQIDREDIALAQRVIKYRPKDVRLNNTFLKYVLLGNEFQNKLMAKATGGTVKGIKGSVLHTLTIPVPPIEEQIRIVEILDKFNEICNDSIEGLPAEIEACHKQYEYYRDKLLTFKRKVV